MTEVTLLKPPLQDERWHARDLSSLPEDGLRYELCEGRLEVSPPAPVAHDVAAFRLGLRLHPVLPEEWDVVTPAAIELTQHDVREPDLVVYRRGEARTANLDPRHVLLVVEVMSPSSVTTDRVVKPLQYAAAGIPHFWRLEPQAPVLVTHALEGEAYRETGRYDDLVALDDPVALRFRLADLLP